ncbi:hypothetical protein AVEN_251673-1 [Araneus ventricosus]|uniref:Uncharacterized protein n=1 Tax=Araneus ventricosus TaxID=182803 RepID=A0A4Y2HFK0_ARAVE|nr:hypothetical protein AVEN_251673-1 [Araneus ventricosus]
MRNILPNGPGHCSKTEQAYGSKKQRIEVNECYLEITTLPNGDDWTSFPELDPFSNGSVKHPHRIVSSISDISANLEKVVKVAKQVAVDVAKQVAVEVANQVAVEVVKAANQEVGKAANQEVVKIANQEVMKAANQEVASTANQEVASTANQEVANTANKEIVKAANEKNSVSGKERKKNPSYT